MMATLKTQIKRKSPEFLLPHLISVHNRWIAYSVHRFDRLHFKKSRFRRLANASKSQLEGKLVFHSHSLEKGLSHSNIRYNFGRAALQALSDTIQEYKRLGYDETSLSFVNALSTVKEYMIAHADAGVDPVELSSIFDEELLDEVRRCNSSLGGVFPLDRRTKTRNKQKNFAELFEGRSSVRTFGDEPVSADLIFSAVKLAMKSPSVCNRQSSRVKLISDSSTIGAILKIQGGFHGYQLPPALLIVTSDLSSFLGPAERNQPFVDGGLFSMSLLLALEYESLAACPLNAMLTARQERAIRRVADISERERVIMFIAVGYFAEQALVPKSFRSSAEDVFNEL